MKLSKTQMTNLNKWLKIVDKKNATINCLRDALKYTVTCVSEHMDKEADKNNTSPTDTVAHIHCMIFKKCTAALSGKETQWQSFTK